MASADTDSSDLTLGQLLARGISSATKVSEADSPNDPAIQKLLQSGLSDLTLCSSLISRLGILSPNETLEDINTRDLRCVLVDCLRGELEVLAKTKGGVERIGWLQRARDNFRNYLELVDRYEIIPEDKRSAFAGPQHATQNPTIRREHKIAQYKLEKEIKGKLEELRKRRQERRPRTRASTSTATTLTAPEEDLDDMAYDSDSDDSDVSRPLFITLLQLHYLRAHAELSSMEQELELLVHGMKMSELPSGRDQRGREEDREKEDESSWRVEQLKDRDGPLLDPEGKVLRPFTILPSHKSAMSTRLRFADEVFRPSHNLPTMTIDEFLEQEQAQGNILQGGGPNSSEAVEQARADEKGEKEEDNVRGWEAEERALKKTREWDEYTDTHRKGEGNMHNRG